MNDERWRAIESAFHAALERAPEERDALLAERLPDDPALVGEVRSLLAVHAQADEFLATPALLRDPSRIGPYIIRRRIAAGGMGVVYEAVREKATRSVALKVLRGGPFVHERHIELFEREIEALKRLRHPAIAALHEAGRTEEGLPYCTMELVEGHTLDEWARRSAPSLEQRLQCFVAICEAVEHAHRSGVVHRDLKPSNVLVDTHGHVKVLDFGLARLVTPDGTDATSSIELAAAMGTLRYMSPEQALGDTHAIGPASDVYALGGMLFELLTDRLALELDGLPTAAAFQVIVDAEPRRPSAYRPELRGNLDTIVIKALEKRPVHRYASAAALGADVRRHLQGAPIQARQPSAVRVIGKIARRHRSLSALVAGLFIATIAIAVGVALHNRTLVRERDRATHAAEVARTESERANAVVRFLNDLLASARPDGTHERGALVRDVLDEAARRLGSGRADLADRAVCGELHGTIGSAYLALGLPADAEVHLLAAIELAPGAEPSARLARVWGDLGLARGQLGDRAQARTHLVRALELQRAVSAEPAVVARTMHNLAEVELALGNAGGAEAQLEAALALDGGAALESGELAGPEVDAVRGRLLWLRGDLAEAETLLRSALERWGAVDPGDRMRVANLHACLGQIAAEREDWKEAEGRYRDALEIRREVLGDQHADTVATINNLATLLVTTGRLEEAEPMLVLVLARWRELLPGNHDDIATTLSTLGALYAYDGRALDAELAFGEALETYRAAKVVGDAALADHVSNLGLLLLELERLDEAQPLLEEALELRRRAGAPRPVGKSLSLLSDLYLVRGALESAEDLARESLAVREQVLAPQHPERIAGLEAVAEVLMASDRLEEALPLLEDAADASLVAFGAGHARVRLSGERRDAVRLELDRRSAERDAQKKKTSSALDGSSRD